MRVGMFAVALVFAVTGCSGGADEGSGEMAEVMCEEFVEDQLRAPSSAEFSEEAHESTGTQSWRVTGVVDSENGFGAMLRADYSCDMRYLGDSEWRATSVDVVPH